MAKTKTLKVKLAVTDVNSVAKSATLEGLQDDVKYFILIDYDIFGDPDDHTPGDVHEMTMKLTKKAPTQAVAKSGNLVVIPGGNCPGSHTKALMKNATATARNYSSVGGAKRITRAKCPHCGKDLSINFYSGEYRKHNP